MTRESELSKLLRIDTASPTFPSRTTRFGRSGVGAETSTVPQWPRQCARMLRRGPAAFGPLALAVPVSKHHAGAVSRDRKAPASAASTRQARLPPRWFIVSFWHGHRALLRVTGGRFGLWRPKPGGWGTLRLTTTGRRTGRSRQVVVGYFADGSNLVTLAMNGWGAAEPAWWLNLQDHPVAIAQTRGGRRQVRARRALGEERERLWSRWAEIDTNLDDYAARRPIETAVVVLEPRDAAEPGT